MKADLYIQGHYFATILIPGDSLLALLAKGMITPATEKLALLQQELDLIDGVACTVHLRFKKPVAFPPPQDNQVPEDVTP